MAWWPIARAMNQSGSVPRALAGKVDEGVDFFVSRVREKNGLTFFVSYRVRFGWLLLLVRCQVETKDIDGRAMESACSTNAYVVVWCKVASSGAHTLLSSIALINVDIAAARPITSIRPAKLVWQQQLQRLFRAVIVKCFRKEARGHRFDMT
ncbi:unnamed protein product, partial [Scytosiphon promiscuus]